MVATAYAAHALSYPRAGWAEQDPAEWVDALIATLRELRDATGGREIVALSFGSQLDGMVAADADGEPLRPALIWSDRRAGAECEAVAARVDVERLRQLTGCNLDPGHVAAKIGWLSAHEPDAFGAAAGVRPSRLVGGVAGERRAGGRSLQRLVDGPAGPARAGVGLRGVRRVRGRRGSPPRVERADAVLGPVQPWLCEATGLSAETLVVMGAGDEMAATLGAGVLEPGVVCDILGTAEPVCAVVGEPAHDESGVVELHPHADPETWLLENPGWLSGGAYRWFRDELGSPEMVRAAQDGSDVYELLDALAEEAPPGAGGVSWLPALAGAMAPEWNASARAAWFGMTAAHGRAHLARALLEGNALALRDVIEAIGAAGHAPSQVVCVGGGAKGRLLCELRAHITGLPVCVPGRRRDDRPRRGDAGRGGRGAALLRGGGGAGDGLPARRAGPAGPGAARGLRRPAPAAPGAVRGAEASLQRAGMTLRS
jgi:xylulokinase